MLSLGGSSTAIHVLSELWASSPLDQVFLKYTSAGRNYLLIHDVFNLILLPSKWWERSSWKLCECRQRSLGEVEDAAEVMRKKEGKGSKGISAGCWHILNTDVLRKIQPISIHTNFSQPILRSCSFFKVRRGKPL